MVNTENNQMAIAKLVKLTFMTVFSAAFALKLQSGTAGGAWLVRDGGRRQRVDLFLKSGCLCVKR